MKISKKQMIRALSIRQENLAEQLFDIMCDSVQIPSADLLCASFQVDGNIYLALLKMNYHSTFVHYQNKDM